LCELRLIIVTGHRTQLTIAITDSATTMKMELENNAASETSRKIFCLYPQLHFRAKH